MKINLIILGPQGCGKGTQAALLAEALDLSHIEVGAVLRGEAKEKTPLGKKINEIINRENGLVSDDIIGEVLHARIKNIPVERGVIVDGAPRRIGQVDEVEDAFNENRRKIDKVIFINIPEGESISRLSKRCACTVCKKNLILENDISDIEESCPVCGGEVKQRADDTPDGVRKRLEIFFRETMPVINHYKQKGMLLEVDGEKEVRQVFKDILDQIGSGDRM